MFERKTFLFLTSLILLTACQLKSPGNSPEALRPRLPVAGQPGLPVVTIQSSPHQEGIRWNLSYSAKCAELSLDKCLGGYGFTLTQDGKFQVGPAPQGEILDGFLDETELKPIVDVFDKLMKRTLEGGDSTEKCTISSPADRDDSSTLSFEGHQKEVLRHTKTQLCFTDLDPEDAQSLEASLAKIVSIYYPSEFPNPCIDTATTLEKHYHSLQQCEKDTDCAYLDDFYVPIDSKVVKSIIMDDCSFIRPLVVANEFNVTSSQRSLLMEREVAKQACATTLMRPGCRRPVVQNTIAGPPVCINRLCQMNPKLRTQ